MLSLPPTVRVFVAVAPLDMRGSFGALAGAVRGLGCVFRSDLGADSGGTWAPIPGALGHPFRTLGH